MFINNSVTWTWCIELIIYVGKIVLPGNILLYDVLSFIGCQRGSCANTRWDWPSLGMTGSSETRRGKQNSEMQRILLINAEYFDLLHDLRHKTSRKVALW